MSTSQKRVLVTGGAGFIGSHLTEALVRSGCEVVVLDNLSTGRLSNLDSVQPHIDFVEEDIRDGRAVAQAARGCSVVFHLAAVVSVPQTVERPLESAEVNELGTLNVLEATRENRVDGFVFASSCAVYGDSPQLPKNERMAPEPLSPYAVQKLAGEYYARVYHTLHGIKTSSLRFFNVFGPRQDPSSPYSGVISIFMNRAAEGNTPTIYGDGSQSRDFIYVTDVVNALLLAGESAQSGGRVFNVGTGRAATVNQLWQMIRKVAGVGGEPAYAAPRPGDVHASLADVTAALEAIGFSARIGFAEGLSKTFGWYTRSR